MRAFVTTRSHGVSFGPVGTVLYAFGYVLYLLGLVVVVTLVMAVKLGVQLYRQWRYHKLPAPPYVGKVGS